MQEPATAEEAHGNAFSTLWDRMCRRRGCPHLLGKRKHPTSFCSSRCRTWAHKHPEDDTRHVRDVLDDLRPLQATIPAAPPVELVQRIGPTPEDIRKAQKAQTVRVLEMLKAGPQTTHTFLAASIGRFGARIHELTRAGWLIEMRKTSKHGASYVLLGRA